MNGPSERCGFDFSRVPSSSRRGGKQGVEVRSERFAAKVIPVLAKGDMRGWWQNKSAPPNSANKPADIVCGASRDSGAGSPAAHGSRRNAKLLGDAGLPAVAVDTLPYGTQFLWGHGLEHSPP